MIKAKESIFVKREKFKVSNENNTIEISYNPDLVISNKDLEWYYKDGKLVIENIPKKEKEVEVEVIKFNSIQGRPKCVESDDKGYLDIEADYIYEGCGTEENKGHTKLIKPKKNKEGKIYGLKHNEKYSAIRIHSYFRIIDKE